MARSLATRVPPEWEKKVGDKEMKKLQHFLIDSPWQVAKLNTLAEPLTRVVPLDGTPIQFHVADFSIPNAFAVPGGHVVVTTGLLDLAEDPEELLGVIAHELAHLTQKHHARRTIASSGPFLVFRVFLHSRSDLLNMMSAGSELLVTQGFSRDYETEADDFGWDYLVKANIDPRGMISIFRKFQGWEKDTGMDDVIPLVFSSHPALDARIVRLEGKWNKLPRQSGFVALKPVNWNKP